MRGAKWERGGDRLDRCVTGLQWQEWERLYTLDESQLALDCARVYMDDFGRRNGIEIALACRPDLVERQTPACDFVYTNEEGQGMAIEVTRPLERKTRELLRQRAWFLEHVQANGAQSNRGRWLVVWGEGSWRPPKDRSRRMQLAAEIAKAIKAGAGSLAALKNDILPGVRLFELIADPGFCLSGWAAGQAVDLSSFMPAVAVRYGDEDCPWSITHAPQLPGHAWGGQEWYKQTLLETERKLRRWADKGYRTLLLLDCRLGADWECTPEDIREWHEHAAIDQEYGFEHEVVPLSSIEHIHEVVLADLSDRGVGFTVAWRAKGIPQMTPDGWSVDPTG